MWLNTNNSNWIWKSTEKIIHYLAFPKAWALLMTFTALLINSVFIYLPTIDLFYANNNLNVLTFVVNAELEKVYEWLTANKISLNTGISNFVIFHCYAEYKVHVFNNKSEKLTCLERKTK